MKQLLLLVTIVITSIQAYTQSQITRREVFDFEVGDSLYYYSYSNMLQSERIVLNLKVIEGKSFSVNSDAVFYNIKSFEEVRVGMGTPYFQSLVSSSNIVETYDNLDSTYIEGFQESDTFYTSKGVGPKMWYDSTIQYWSIRNDTAYGYYGFDYGMYIWDVYYVSYAVGLGITKRGAGREFDNSGYSSTLEAYHKVNGNKWGTIYTDFVSSIDNIKNQPFKLYPNPVNDILHLDFETAFTGEVSIHSFDGSCVYTNAINHPHLSIDTKNFVSGVYFITIKNKDVINTTRFAKQ